MMAVSKCDVQLLTTLGPDPFFWDTQLPVACVVGLVALLGKLDGLKQTRVSQHPTYFQITTGCCVFHAFMAAP